VLRTRPASVQLLEKTMISAAPTVGTSVYELGNGIHLLKRKTEPDGRSIYAARAETGMSVETLMLNPALSVPPA